MKNIPPKIYLQVDPFNESPPDFNQVNVQWCEDRINESDVEYVRKDAKKLTEIKNVALVVRKTQGGGVLIFGKGLETPIELTDDEDYLFMGSITIDAAHIFREYKPAPGTTPDNMLRWGNGLDHENYKTKIK